MIAPRRDQGGLRAVVLGLQPEEKNILYECVDQAGGTLVSAESNMELWNCARQEPVDLSVIGQCEAIPDPVYLAWLMRGHSRHTRIVLVLNPLTEEERRMFAPMQSIHILERPLDPERLMDIVKEAGTLRAFDLENLADPVGFQIPIRRAPVSEEAEIDF